GVGERARHLVEDGGDVEEEQLLVLARVALETGVAEAALAGRARAFADRVHARAAVTEPRGDGVVDRVERSHRERVLERRPGAARPGRPRLRAREAAHHPHARGDENDAREQESGHGGAVPPQAGRRPGRKRTFLSVTTSCSFRTSWSACDRTLPSSA